MDEGNGGVDEGGKRGGRDQKKKEKREKVRGGGYRVGMRGEEKERGELVDG